MIVHGPYPVGEPRVAREAAAARAAGWEVDVLALQRPGDARAEHIDGVHVTRLPITHRRGASFVQTVTEYVGFAARASLASARMHLSRRYDVVHVHNPPDFLIVAALLPRALGAKVVFDVHDLASDMFAMRFGDGRGASVAGRVLRLVERAAARLAHAVVTVHEPYRAELARRGVPLARTFVIMNSLDESLLPARRRPSEASRVVYHGTVTPSYGLDLVIQAAASIRNAVPDLTVEIYGEGDAVPQLRHQIAELELGAIVRISNRMLPLSEVLSVVDGAAVGLVPNLPSALNRFALSSKLFEYVALEVPAVVADLPTLRAHFSDEEVSFFRAGDSADLARAIRAALADSDQSRRRAQAARRRYESYRWSEQAQVYVRLLEQLVGRR